MLQMRTELFIFMTMRYISIRKGSIALHDYRFFGGGGSPFLFPPGLGGGSPRPLVGFFGGAKKRERD